MQPTWPWLFTHAMLVFYYPWFISIQCLFLIGQGLHPCIFVYLRYHAYALPVFHWSPLTPMHFYIPQVSRLHIACFLLVTGFTHAFLYASGITPTHFCFSGSHFVDFIYDQMYQSTSSADFTASQGNIRTICVLT